MLCLYFSGISSKCFFFSVPVRKPDDQNRYVNIKRLTDYIVTDLFNIIINLAFTILYNTNIIRIFVKCKRLLTT